jgi:translocation and assembly module TamB
VRNFLQGVNVTDGSVAIACRAAARGSRRSPPAAAAAASRSKARRASTSAGGAAQLTADRFEMLGRVDRRIVASGNAALRLDAKTLALEGRFGVDEGLVDFSRSDAPASGDDVE